MGLYVPEPVDVGDLLRAGVLLAAQAGDQEPLGAQRHDQAASRRLCAVAAAAAMAALAAARLTLYAAPGGGARGGAQAKAGDGLLLSRGRWAWELRDGGHYRLRGTMQFRNLTERQELFVNDVAGSAKLLSNGSPRGERLLSKTTSASRSSVGFGHDLDTLPRA
eukprot:SM000258S09124  [mRNA]  locus=s258:80498:82167:- [translate_table: standard]